MDNNNNNNNYNNNSNNSFSGGLGDRMRVYLIVIIFGYFLIKLFFAAFGVYPDKYYNQTITLNTNDGDTKEQIVNAYVPGVWNSELTDFLIMVIMCIILFFVKFNNVFPLTQNGSSMNYALWIPFMFGMIIPAVKASSFSNSTSFNNAESIVIVFIGFAMILYNFFITSSASGYRVKYLVYTGLIILIAILLYVLRNKSSVFTNVLYNIRDKNSENCTRYDMENIVVKSSGEQFRVNSAFITWLVLLLVSFNGGAVSNVVNGLLLGIFVGSVSFEGMEYPIIKTASDFCATPEECNAKNIPYDSMSNSTKGCDPNTIKKLDEQTKVMEGKINTNTWTVVAVSLTLILVLSYLAIKMN